MRARRKSQREWCRAARLVVDNDERAWRIRRDVQRAGARDNRRGIEATEGDCPRQRHANQRGSGHRYPRPFLSRLRRRRVQVIPQPIVIVVVVMGGRGRPGRSRGTDRHGRRRPSRIGRGKGDGWRHRRQLDVGQRWRHRGLRFRCRKDGQSNLRGFRLRRDGHRFRLRSDWLGLLCDRFRLRCGGSGFGHTKSDSAFRTPAPVSAPRRPVNRFCFPSNDDRLGPLCRQRLPLAAEPQRTDPRPAFHRTTQRSSSAWLDVTSLER